MFTVTKIGVWMQCAVKNFLLANIPKYYKDKHASNRTFAERRVKKRIAMGAGSRQDLMEGLLAPSTTTKETHEEQPAMPLPELVANANLFIIAGSETTATLLSGVTYLLARNPAKLARLTAEVRGAFAREADISIAAVGRLPYLLACLEEALRSYPPVPGGLPRVVPKGGRTFLGRFVPEGVCKPQPAPLRFSLAHKEATHSSANAQTPQTHVSIWQYAASHYSANWTDPFAYAPERFLDGENARYAGDRRDAMQPFSAGPRNCIGKNLAHAEMRTILARVVWNFDMELASGSEEWMLGQRVFNLWAKPPLMVVLRPRA